MRSYPVKTPRIVQSIFSKYIWCFPVNKESANQNSKEIYLTFDDGPIPEITPWVLQELSEYKAKATFFCIGENVRKYPEIFRKIISNGHSIGNHTYNHLNGWKTSKKRYLNNVEKAEKCFQSRWPSGSVFSPDSSWDQSSVSGLRSSVFSTDSYRDQSSLQKQSTTNHQLSTKLFRPPYGRIKPNQANKILKKGYEIIMWDVLSGDFDLSLSKEECLKNVLKNAHDGSIVVFHDSEKAFKNLEYVLPRTLEHFTEKGFVFKAI